LLSEKNISSYIVTTSSSDEENAAEEEEEFNFQCDEGLDNSDVDLMSRIE
jgi:hypothetical protein